MLDHEKTEFADAMSIGGSMWLLVAREARPDATCWPGRRLLATIDAIAWPLLWALAFSHAPAPVGLVGPFVVAVVIVCSVSRLYRALCVNHRYRFTTWQWGGIAAALVLVGMVLKLTMSG